MFFDPLQQIYAFRVPPEKKEGGVDAPKLAEEETGEVTPEAENYILCRQCRQAITSPSDRIAMQGAHQHTFANPHGAVFEIGCFKTAKGCGYAGLPTDEFSWFAGFSWRVCFCTMCLTHLGWLFISGAGDMFHGLILDRLIEPD